MFIDNGIKLWDIEYKLGNQFLNCVASNYYTIYSLECARNMNVFDDKCANDIVIRRMIYVWENNVICTICPKVKYWFNSLPSSLYSLRHRLIHLSQLLYFLLLNHISLKRGNDKVRYKLYCSIFLLPVHLYWK